MLPYSLVKHGEHLLIKGRHPTALGEIRSTSGNTGLTQALDLHKMKVFVACQQELPEKIHDGREVGQQGILGRCGCRPGQNTVRARSARRAWGQPDKDSGQRRQGLGSA